MTNFKHGIQTGERGIPLPPPLQQNIEPFLLFLHHHRNQLFPNMRPFHNNRANRRNHQTKRKDADDRIRHHKRSAQVRMRDNYMVRQGLRKVTAVAEANGRYRYVDEVDAF